MRKERLVDNIYIKALEIGTKNLDNGIAFDDLKRKLDVDKKSMMFRDNFRNWFYENFFHVESIDVKQKNLRGNFTGFPKHIDTQCSILTGKAYMDYLDYIELQEARQSSKTAKTIAITSIIITGLIALAQIVISICN